MHTLARDTGRDFLSLSTATWPYVLLQQYSLLLLVHTCYSESITGSVNKCDVPMDKLINTIGVAFLKRLCIKQTNLRKDFLCTLIQLAQFGR